MLEVLNFQIQIYKFLHVILLMMNNYQLNLKKNNFNLQIINGILQKLKYVNFVKLYFLPKN